jgi:hypothetical protein
MIGAVIGIASIELPISVQFPETCLRSSALLPSALFPPSSTDGGSNIVRGGLMIGAVIGIVCSALALVLIVLFLVKVYLLKRITSSIHQAEEMPTSVSTENVNFATYENLNTFEDNLSWGFE